MKIKNISSAIILGTSLSLSSGVLAETKKLQHRVSGKTSKIINTGDYNTKLIDGKYYVFYSNTGYIQGFKTEEEANKFGIKLSRIMISFNQCIHRDNKGSCYFYPSEKSGKKILKIKDNDYHGIFNFVDSRLLTEDDFDGISLESVCDYLNLITKNYR